MSCCHEPGQGRIAEDGVVGEADGGDVEIDQLRAEIVVGAESYRKSDLPQGAGRPASDARERLAGLQPLPGYAEEVEGLNREHAEARTAIDESSGDGHLADGGLHSMGSAPEQAELEGWSSELKVSLADGSDRSGGAPCRMEAAPTRRTNGLTW